MKDAETLLNGAGNVKQELHKSLMETDPRVDPMGYLNLLDQYEHVVLQETQQQRREKLSERMGLQNDKQL